MSTGKSDIVQGVVHFDPNSSLSFNVNRSFALRAQSLQSNGDNGAILLTIPVMQSGSNFNQQAAGSDAVDNVAPVAGTDNKAIVMVRLTGLDRTGNNWDRLTSLPDNADSQAVLALGNLATVARNQGFNGSTWDRLNLNSALNIATGIKPFSLQTSNPGEWAMAETQGPGIRSTRTIAAGGAGVRHIARSLAFSLSAVNAQGLVNCVIRDGASGAGVILWTMTVIAAAGTNFQIALSGLNLFGSANTAMTFEWTAAPAAGNVQATSGSGYSTI